MKTARRVINYEKIVTAIRRSPAPATSICARGLPSGSRPPVSPIRASRICASR